MCQILTRSSKKSRLFFSDIRGSATPVLVFAITVTIGFAALLLDVSRVFALQSKLHTATEMAALTVAKNLHFIDDHELSRLGQEILSANLASGSVLIANDETAQDLALMTNVSVSSGNVTVSAQATAKTYLLRIFNFLNDMTVSSAVSVRSVMPEAELVLVLDSSVMMESSGKLSDVKISAFDFINALEMHEKEKEGIQFAIVPFGGAYINVAPHKDWIEAEDWPVNVPPSVPGTKSWAGPLEQERWCVGVRDGLAGETDIPPDLSKFPLVLDISSSLNSTTGLPHYSVTTTSECRAVSIRHLAGSSADLLQDLVALSGVGGGGLERGMIWAERVLSPDWRSAWQAGGQHPVDYTDPEFDKIVLLVSGSGNGSFEGQNELLSTVCSRLKTKGVKIYVVEYQSPADLADPLRLCATSDGYYFSVTSGVHLREVFTLIGTFLTVIKTNS